MDRTLFCACLASSISELAAALSCEGCLPDGVLIAPRALSARPRFRIRWEGERGISTKWNGKGVEISASIADVSE